MYEWVIGYIEEPQRGPNLQYLWNQAPGCLFTSGSNRTPVPNFLSNWEMRNVFFHPGKFTAFEPKNQPQLLQESQVPFCIHHPEALDDMSHLNLLHEKGHQHVSTCQELAGTAIGSSRATQDVRVDAIVRLQVRKVSS